MSKTSVYVGCKLPHGLIMEIGTVVSEKGPNDGRFHVTERVRLNGANHGVLVSAAASSAPSVYGITKVDADFMETWLKANADKQYVKDKLIFMVDDLKSATDMARDGKSLRTGLEANDPAKAPNGIKRATQHDSLVMS